MCLVAKNSISAITINPIMITASTLYASIIQSGSSTERQLIMEPVSTMEASALMT